MTIRANRRVSQKRPKRPKAVADAMHTPMERSFAQKLRTDRVESYATPAARASYWAHRTAQLQAEQDATVSASVKELSNGLSSEARQFGPSDVSTTPVASASQAPSALPPFPVSSK